MPGSQAKSGGAKKYGRNKIKCQRYRDRDTRFRNKMKRILRSNGPAAAQRYKIAHLRGERARV
jgi:hypothetical protein